MFVRNMGYNNFCALQLLSHCALARRDFFCSSALLRHFTVYIRHFPFYSNTNFTVLQSIISFFPFYNFKETPFPFYRVAYFTVLQPKFCIFPFYSFKKRSFYILQRTYCPPSLEEYRAHKVICLFNTHCVTSYLDFHNVIIFLGDSI